MILIMIFSSLTRSVESSCKASKNIFVDGNEYFFSDESGTEIYELPEGTACCENDNLIEYQDSQSNNGIFK